MSIVTCKSYADPFKYTNECIPDFTYKTSGYSLIVICAQLLSVIYKS